jgi:putative spermidine/putrescine transport system substrate-binding protein
MLMLDAISSAAARARGSRGTALLLAGGVVASLAGGGLAAGAQAPSSKLQALIAAAKKEGQLNVIALPPDWANYGAIISAFSKKYGIKVNSSNPNGSSADELTAAKALKGQSRAPDVFDVAPQFAEQGRQEGLFAPYKVSTWSSIPAALKNAKGYWVGDYWGVIAFGVNTSVQKTVPTSWADLAKPDYKGQVALNGDPRKAGAAFGGVYAASLANGGSLGNITPGITFFAGLKKDGNLLPVDATPATVANGQTPVTVDWSYLQRGYQDQFKGKLSWTVSVPSGPAFANYYAQAISASAPHPNAARLWEEFLYSDEGQNLWMKGYAYAARYLDMKQRGVIPASVLKNLPPASVAKQAKFPTLAQINSAKGVLESQWGPAVSGA